MCQELEGVGSHGKRGKEERTKFDEEERVSME